MTSEKCDFRFAILAETVKGRGAIDLCRNLAKLQRQEPDLDIEQGLGRLVTRSVDEGKDLVSQYEQKGIEFLTIIDPAYPFLLKAIDSPPVCFFISGPIRNLQRPAIAIVGARACTLYGRQVARQLAVELGSVGFAIVSGLALGIDAQAHEACVQNKIPTIAVMGSGIDHIYPKCHTELARTIVRDGGTVITEFPPGTPPKSHHFPIRNRIISGLARATVIIEAKARSGSLSTARHCLDQGRELFAVPGPIHHETSEGTHHLIQAGEAQLITGTKDVLQSLNPLLISAIKQAATIQEKIHDPLARQIYARLDAFEPTSFDEIVSDLNIAPGSTSSALIQLEQLCLVAALPGQRWLRHPINSEPSGAHAHG